MIRTLGGAYAVRNAGRSIGLNVVRRSNPHFNQELNLFRSRLRKDVQLNT
jgi:hypothetical protein